MIDSWVNDDWLIISWWLGVSEWKVDNQVLVLINVRLWALDLTYLWLSRLGMDWTDRTRTWILTIEVKVHLFVMTRIAVVVPGAGMRCSDLWDSLLPTHHTLAPLRIYATSAPSHIQTNHYLPASWDNTTKKTTHFALYAADTAWLGGIETSVSRAYTQSSLGRHTANMWVAPLL